jgi:mono/diheme cytochrome c family protein
MKAKFLPIVFIVAAVVLVIWFFNHSGFFPYAHNPMQYMPNMHRTLAVKPMRAYRDEASVRNPPEGTLALNQKKYPYTKETPASDVEKKSNPLPASRANVLRGKKKYMETCVVCHGPGGKGDGYIVPPFTLPPSLVSEKISGFADSQIFHVITVGQNVMGSYAPQIREEDRWAVVHYVRVLQRAENPTEADLKAFEDKK